MLRTAGIAFVVLVGLAGCQSGGPAVLSILFQSTPGDDGTTCYDPQRRAFYAAVADANQAQSAVAAVGSLLPSLFSAGTSGSPFLSTISRELASNFEATMSGFLTDLQNDRTRIQTVTTRFDALVLCRRSEAAAINRDFRAGRISRTDAQQRMSRLRDLLRDDVEAARRTNAVLDERNREFQVAAAQARNTAAQAPSQAERREREGQVRQAEAATQTNQRALNEQTSSVAQAEQLVASPSLQLGALGPRRMRA
jgi:hypothetical protein